MDKAQVQEIIARAEAGNSEAQFLLSQLCGQHGDLHNMVFWLRKASAKDNIDAIETLGHCYEIGQGVTPDLSQSLAYYDRAINAGACFANYQKAQLLYKSSSGLSKQSTIKRLLLNAAKADFVPALRTIGYLAMQHKYSHSLAIDCFRRAGHLGDPISPF